MSKAEKKKQKNKFPVANANPIIDTMSGRLMLIACLLHVSLAATLTKDNNSDDPEPGPEFWNRTSNALFGPTATDCANRVYPLRELVKDLQLPEDLGDCKDNPSINNPLGMVCFATLYQLDYVCRHKPLEKEESIYSSDVKEHPYDDLCNELSAAAIDISSNSESKANKLLTATVSQLKNKTLCPVCNEENAKSVCKHLLFTYRAIAILDFPKKTSSEPEETTTKATSKSSKSSTNELRDSAADANSQNDENEKVEKPPTGVDDENRETDQPQKKEESPHLEEPKKDDKPSVNKTNSSTTTSTTSNTLVVANTTLPVSTTNESVIANEQDDIDMEVEVNDEDLTGPRDKEEKETENKVPVLVDHLSHKISDEEPGYFVSYFILVSIVAISAYLVFHNKQKILALILEGRRGRQSKGRRRTSSSSAQYRKLDNNLEEAMGPNSKDSVPQVVY